MSSPPLVERLRQAAAAVCEAELPAELRSTGLVLAFWAQEDGPPERGGPERRTDGQDASVDVAANLGVAAEVLESIFDFDDGDVALIVPRRLLGASKSAAATEIAHLIIAARQSGGLGEWTPSEAVRQACDAMGVLDGNFGRVVQQLNGNGFRVRGTGTKREFKMNASGFAVAAALINRISVGLS